MTQRIKLQVGGRSWTAISPMPASRLISGITDPDAFSLAVTSANQRAFQAGDATPTMTDMPCRTARTACLALFNDTFVPNPSAYRSAASIASSIAPPATLSFSFNRRCRQQATAMSRNFLSLAWGRTASSIASSSSEASHSEFVTTHVFPV